MSSNEIPFSDNFVNGYYNGLPSKLSSSQRAAMDRASASVAFITENMANHFYYMAAGRIQVELGSDHSNPIIGRRWLYEQLAICYTQLGYLDDANTALAKAQVC